MNTDVKWKPIDKVAWRVVAPAPWYCKPPDLSDIESVKYELERAIRRERTFEQQRARRDARAKAKGTFTAISSEEIESIANKRKALAFQIEQLANMLLDLSGAVSVDVAA